MCFQMSPKLSVAVDLSRHRRCKRRRAVSIVNLRRSNSVDNADEKAEKLAKFWIRDKAPDGSAFIFGDTGITSQYDVGFIEGSLSAYKQLDLFNRCDTINSVRQTDRHRIDRQISSQLRHVSTIGKKLVKQQYLLYMSSQYGELRPTSYFLFTYIVFFVMGHEPATGINWLTDW